jgi:putative membrane protein
MAALWLARSARAQQPEADAATPPRAGEPKPTTEAGAARRAAFAGYAAESARTATRLPPEERGARGFLRAAALSARFELEASRLAATRAHSLEVLAYAADLLQYQEMAQLELLHLLHARGMAQPMMDSAQRKALNRLGRLTGPAFDREYVELMGRRQQREDVLQYERAALGMADPVLRGWIDRQLPSLRAQEAAAQRLGIAPAARRPDAARSAAVMAGAGSGRQRAE